MVTQPVKMMYEDRINNTKFEVVVYSFHLAIEDDYETYVTCWAPHCKTWMTVPVCYLTPLTERELLNE